MEDPAIKAVRDAFMTGVCSKISGADYHANRALMDAMAEGVVEAIREYERRYIAAKNAATSSKWW